MISFKPNSKSQNDMINKLKKIRPSNETKVQNEIQPSNDKQTQKNVKLIEVKSAKIINTV
jgi:hypothetical protein